MTSNSPPSAAAEVQTLLRFLSQDARIPLSTALSKINDLRKAKLNTPEAISKSNALVDLSPLFSGDEKLAKQILAAAKRVLNPKSKKRSASGDDSNAGSSKRTRGPIKNGPSGHAHQQSPAELEASLALPTSALSIQDLESITLQTNRAPLLLAFAVTLLKYTMPEQPLSSRLSLAQAVVSANSRAKARSVGLVDGKSAEDEGWGSGQPRVRLMGREVAVMRRSGYYFDAPVEGSVGQGGSGGDGKEGEETAGSQATVKGEEEADNDDSGVFFPRETQQLPKDETKELPLWGLDLEALKKINSNSSGGPLTQTTSSNRVRISSASNPGLPIHTPQSACSYLLKSFTQIQHQTQPEDSSNPDPPPSNPTTTNTTTTAAAKNKPPIPPPTPQPAAQKARTALSHLLQSLDILISSWTDTLPVPDRDELDRRAWGWYIRVRPDVEAGEKGWGQKGRLPLGRILGLRKEGVKVE